jgi:hypothetical protein
LNIGAGDRVVLGSTAGGPSTLALGSLTIDPAGTLDIGRGSVRVHYTGASPVGTLAAYIASGFDGGHFDGHGITTSAGSASFGVGYADSADGAVTGLAANTVLLKYARFGDANLDGTVSFPDLLRLAQHFGQANTGWDNGDFNYDGATNFADLLTLAQNFGQAGAATAAASAPPAASDALSLLLKARRAPRLRA